MAFGEQRLAYINLLQTIGALRHFRCDRPRIEYEAAGAVYLPTPVPGTCFVVKHCDSGRGDAGTEVGRSMVRTARSLPGPGFPRAPRTATRPTGERTLWISRLRKDTVPGSVDSCGDQPGGAKAWRYTAGIAIAGHELADHQAGCAQARDPSAMFTERRQRKAAIMDRHGCPSAFGRQRPALFCYISPQRVTGDREYAALYRCRMHVTMRFHSVCSTPACKARGRAQALTGGSGQHSAEVRDEME